MQQAPRFLITATRAQAALPSPASRRPALLSLIYGGAALSVALLAGCAESQAKQVPPQAEGGAAGEASASSDVAGAASDPEQGGAGNIGEGEAGANTGGSGAGTGGTPTGAGGSGGASQGGGDASQGGASTGEAGAGMGALAGAGGSDDGPSFPVSVCGPGQWFAGEGLCAECPQTRQVFELACADYAGAQILTTSGQLQFAFASLPSGVQGHEASPVDLSVTYLEPNESHARLLRFNTTGWTVDLRQAPEPPQTVIVPPFSTADVCGDVFHSLEPVRFERASSQAVSYTKVCP